MHDITQVCKHAFRELKLYERIHWKEAQGEVHTQHNEIPVWILLYHDSHIVDVHSEFCRIVSKYFEAVSPLEFTVHYLIYANGYEHSLEFLADNNEILEHLDDTTLGAFPDRRPMPAESIFVSRNSARLISGFVLSFPRFVVPGHSQYMIHV